MKVALFKTHFLKSFYFKYFKLSLVKVGMGDVLRARSTVIFICHLQINILQNPVAAVCWEQ